MKKSRIKKIMDRCIKTWESRGVFPDPNRLSTIRDMLAMSPHEDGRHRVINSETGDIHLVPFEDVILNGLSFQQLQTYPVEK